MCGGLGEGCVYVYVCVYVGVGVWGAGGRVCVCVCGSVYVCQEHKVDFKDNRSIDPKRYTLISA